MQPSEIEQRASRFDYAGIWQKLTLDERNFLAVLPIYYTPSEAARYIGRDRKWLYRIRKKPHVRAAIEARDRGNTEEVMGLLLDDMFVKLTQSLSDSLNRTQLSEKELKQMKRSITLLRGRFR